MDLVVANALVVPGGDASPFRGWIGIEGERIATVGRDGEPEPAAAEHIDARGGPVIPGLVNIHSHSHSSLTRGSAEGRPLEAWIAAIEREQRILDDEDAYWAGLATYAEMLLSGTTTALDMCIRPGPALEAAKTIGLRATIAPYCADTKPFCPTLDANRALLRQSTDRVRVWVGLHDLESCSDAQIVAGVALARDEGVGVHLHCSESRFSVAATKKRTGRTPIAHLAALGVLSEKTILAHCVWADADDRERLASTGTAVAHCPQANLKLASGIAPIPEMLARGVRVGLASDGAKANNVLDLFDAMKFASLPPKGVRNDAKVLPAPTVFEMATAGGADALGLDAGTIAPGKLADLAILDARALHLQPLLPEVIVTNLVHAARGGDVRTTIVGGKVVMREREIAAVPLAKIVDRLAEIGTRLVNATTDAA